MKEQIKINIIPSVEINMSFGDDDCHKPEQLDIVFEPSCIIGACAGFVDNCTFRGACTDALWCNSATYNTLDPDRMFKAIVEFVEEESDSLGHIQCRLNKYIDRAAKT